MIVTLVLGLATAIAVGLATGYLGSLMVLKRMALVGDALSHVALPGLGLGILFNFNPFFGAFVFLFISAVIIWHVERITRLSVETIVGAMFTLSLAVGILIIPQFDLLEALFGDIAKVSLESTIIAIAASLLAVLLTRMIYKNLILSMISEELASSAGINVARANLLFLLLVSLTVAAGLQIVGTLLVGFLVVVPAATARIISSNMFRYAVLSSLFGIISSSSGVLFSAYLNLPPGPLIVFSGIVVFLVAVIVRSVSKGSFF
jgi:ABC-type Mn2+/Zn2+ transport system permease subunit